jgi:dipeptidase D
VIPREAHAVVRVGDMAALTETLVRTVLERKLPGELAFESLDENKHSSAVFADYREVLREVLAAPHGPLRHLQDASVTFATVETSAATDVVTFGFFARSSCEDSLTQFAAELEQRYAQVSAVQHSFAAWQPQPHAFFTRLVARAAAEQNPPLYAVHAGLECGVILQRAAGRLQAAASIGPTIRGAHSPDERLSVQSCVRFVHWIDQIVAALEQE